MVELQVKMLSRHWEKIWALEGCEDSKVIHMEVQMKIMRVRVNLFFQGTLRRPQVGNLLRKIFVSR